VTELGNTRTFYVTAKSKRSARRAANADWRWYRTWNSNRESVHLLAEQFGNKVYAFEATADLSSVRLDKRD